MLSVGLQDGQVQLYNQLVCVHHKIILQYKNRKNKSVFDVDIFFLIL